MHKMLNMDQNVDKCSNIVTNFQSQEEKQLSDLDLVTTSYVEALKDCYSNAKKLPYLAASTEIENNSIPKVIRYDLNGDPRLIMCSIVAKFLSSKKISHTENIEFWPHLKKTIYLCHDFEVVEELKFWGFCFFNDIIKHLIFSNSTTHLKNLETLINIEVTVKVGPYNPVLKCNILYLKDKLQFSYRMTRIKCCDTQKKNLHEYPALQNLLEKLRSVNKNEIKNH